MATNGLGYLLVKYISGTVDLFPSDSFELGMTYKGEEGYTLKVFNGVLYLIDLPGAR